MNIQPSCYGKSWDPNHVECRGGLDPAYENPRDQTHRRDECAWLRPCGQIVEADRAKPRIPEPLIPAQALVHRPAVAPAPPASPPRPLVPPYIPPRPPTQHMPPTPSYQQYTHPQPTPAPQYYQQQQFAQPMMVPPHVAQYGPQYVYPPYQMPGSQMPQYLTVPEPAQEGVHWAVRLGRDIFRSLVKAFGHTLSAYADSNPFGKYKQ